MIKLAREEGVLPCIAKVLSAQTFPAQHFESFGIDTSMMYDKTDAPKNVFADVAIELLDNCYDIDEWYHINKKRKDNRQLFNFQK